MDVELFEEIMEIKESIELVVNRINDYMLEISRLRDRLNDQDNHINYLLKRLKEMDNNI